MLTCFFNEQELGFIKPEFVWAAVKSKTKTILNLLSEGYFYRVLFHVNQTSHICKVSAISIFYMLWLQPAWNIVKLGPGLAEVKSVDHNTFVIITSKKEYRYGEK